MSLLRQCLLEVRSRQENSETLTDQNALSTAGHALDQTAMKPGNDMFYASLDETLTHHTETSCSSLYSNPRFTEPA